MVACRSSLEPCKTTQLGLRRGDDILLCLPFAVHICRPRLSSSGAHIAIHTPSQPIHVSKQEHITANKALLHCFGVSTALCICSRLPHIPTSTFP